MGEYAEFKKRAVEYDENIDAIGPYAVTAPLGGVIGYMRGKSKAPLAEQAARRGIQAETQNLKDLIWQRDWYTKNPETLRDVYRWNQSANAAESQIGAQAANAMDNYNAVIRAKEEALLKPNKWLKGQAKGKRVLSLPPNTTHSTIEYNPAYGKAVARNTRIKHGLLGIGGGLMVGSWIDAIRRAMAEPED